MKKHLRPLLAGMFLGIGLVLGIAAAVRIQPVPVAWGDRTGTNGFGLNATSVPYVNYQGTNWTGISTNFHVGTNTCRLVIINGLVVGTTAP